MGLSLPGVVIVAAAVVAAGGPNEKPRGAGVGVGAVVVADLLI